MTTSTFTATCPCGETTSVVDGQEQPHTCRPITAQQVRDAWAEGYKWARNELRPLVEDLAPYDGRLIIDTSGKEACVFCGERRGRHFLVHDPACPWKRAWDAFVSSPSAAVSDEPPHADLPEPAPEPAR